MDLMRVPVGKATLRRTSVAEFALVRALCIVCVCYIIAFLYLNYKLPQPFLLLQLVPVVKKLRVPTNVSSKCLNVIAC